MKIAYIALVGICIWLLGASTAQAQKWGDFEAIGDFINGRGGNKSIDQFVNQRNPLVQLTGKFVTYITAVIVVIGLIAFVVAGYIYMTAGGDSTRVGLAKTIMLSALLGIVLALASVLILQTINTQLIPTEDPKVNEQPGIVKAIAA